MSFLGSVAGSLLGGVDKALGGWISGEIGNHYQKKMMDYQNSLDIANWNMVNAYNTPSAQMARYKDAGLNPNLIYGQQNTSSAIAQPSAKSPVEFGGSSLDLFQRMKQMDADTKNKYEQNSLLQSQTDYVKAQVEGQNIENDLKRKVLESLGGPGANPNDPYWYRDFKKFIGWLFNEPSMSGVGTPAVPNRTVNVFDYIPEHPVRNRLRVQGDRGGRK